MFRRTITCGRPVVAESWRTYSSGVCVPSPSGSVAVVKSSAAFAESATSSRIEKAASDARIACCDSSCRSRRTSPSSPG